MGFKEILAVILAGALANNYALRNFVGVESILGETRCTCRSLILGAAVTVTMVLSAIITRLMQTYVLAGGLESLQLLMFVLVTLAVTAVVETGCKALVKKSLGTGFTMLALNSAVLGGCLMNVSATFGEAAFAALGGGVGFTLALLLYGGLRNKIDDEAAPKALRGLPLSLLTAGMICLALSAL